MTPSIQRLRVAFLTRRFGARFGGAEAYGEHVVAFLRQHHDVHVFCQEWDSPLPVAHTLLPRRRSLPRWLNLIDFNRRCAAHLVGFDVVHSHENGWVGDVQVVHVMPVRYARLCNGRSLRQRLADLSSPRWLAYLLMEALRIRASPGKVVVAASALIADQLALAYPGSPPATVIPPGVALPPGTPDRAAAHDQLGLDSSSTYALLLANDPVRKGLPTLLDALPMLPAGLCLMVAGGDEAMAQRVRVMARDAGQASRVHVWPGQRDVSVFYAAADLCVFPTRGDAFGMVPLEAMAHRLPVIMSGPRQCGFARHVRHDSEALLLDDAGDAIGLAQNVRRLLDDAVLRDKLARNGARLAASFDWDIVGRAFETVYAQVVRAHEPPPPEMPPAEAA